MNTRLVPGVALAIVTIVGCSGCQSDHMQQPSDNAALPPMGTFGTLKEAMGRTPDSIIDMCRESRSAHVDWGKPSDVVARVFCPDGLNDADELIDLEVHAPFQGSFYGVRLGDLAAIAEDTIRRQYPGASVEHHPWPAPKKPTNSYLFRLDQTRILDVTIVDGQVTVIKVFRSDIGIEGSPGFRPTA